MAQRLMDYGTRVEEIDRRKMCGHKLERECEVRRIMRERKMRMW